MSAMEKMLASMMGITPEEMQETARTVIALAQNGAAALEQLQKDVSEIKQYLMPTIIDNDPSIARGNFKIEDQTNVEGN